MLKVSRILVAAYQTWSSFIRGEYWLSEDGTSEYADGDTGDRGHEQIAMANMLSYYSDKLENAFAQYFESIRENNPEEYEELHQHYEPFFRGPDPDDFTTDCCDMEGGLEDLYYNFVIPDEVGQAALGQVWVDIKKDIRAAYAKYFHVAHVINSSFSVWQLTPRMIHAIQDFILEQADENGLEESNLPGSIAIEEASTGHYSEIPCEEFLTMKYPQQVFMVQGKSARRKKFAV